MSGAWSDIPPGDFKVVAAFGVTLALERGVVVGLDPADPIGAGLSDRHDDAENLRH